VTQDAPRYWFRAKRYGWGWGLPLTWQGWVVLIAYIAALLVPLAFGAAAAWVSIAALVVGTPIMVWIGYRKGERPAWRWGRSRD
jgi:hypothetical protein